MTEEKTLGQIGFETNFDPSAWEDISEFHKNGWEIAASAVREKVIEECEKAIEAQIEAFSSDEYATNQPLSSFQERFACMSCLAGLRYLKASEQPPTSGDRTALHPDQRSLETNLIHPHPRQDGQQCDHPGSESLTVENAPIGTKAPAFGGGYWILVSDGAWKWSSGSSTFPRPGGDWNGFLIPPPTSGDRTTLPNEQTMLKQ